MKEEIGHELEELVLRLERLKKAVQLPVAEERSMRVVRRYWNAPLRYSGRRSSDEQAREFMDAVQPIFNWTIGSHS